MPSGLRCRSVDGTMAPIKGTVYRSCPCRGSPDAKRRFSDERRRRFLGRSAIIAGDTSAGSVWARRAGRENIARVQDLVAAKRRPAIWMRPISAKTANSQPHGATTRSAPDGAHGDQRHRHSETRSSSRRASEPCRVPAGLPLNPHHSKGQVIAQRSGAGQVQCSQSRDRQHLRRAISPTGVPTVHDKEHAADSLARPRPAKRRPPSSTAQMRDSGRTRLSAPRAKRRTGRCVTAKTPGQTRVQARRGIPSLPNPAVERRNYASGQQGGEVRTNGGWQRGAIMSVANIPRRTARTSNRPEKPAETYRKRVMQRRTASASRRMPKEFDRRGTGRGSRPVTSPHGFPYGCIGARRGGRGCRRRDGSTPQCSRLCVDKRDDTSRFDEHAGLYGITPLLATFVAYRRGLRSVVVMIAG